MYPTATAIALSAGTDTHCTLLAQASLECTNKMETLSFVLTLVMRVYFDCFVSSSVRPFSSHTFKALRDGFLLLPPPCEEPELLLPDLSLPSPPWLFLGPSRCWPAPRRRPSWRLSLDIGVCWVVGRWKKNVHGQRFPVFTVDGKTCQVNTCQWGQPNKAGSRPAISVWLASELANYWVAVGWTTCSSTNQAEPKMGKRVEVCFLRVGFEAVCHSNHWDRENSSVELTVSQVTYVMQEIGDTRNPPSN